MSFFKWADHQIYYQIQGNGPLLLVLPGNTASSACYLGEIEYFSRHYRVASLDFLGTGKSDRLTKWTTDWWFQAVKQAKGLIEHLEYENCMLVGTSGGAVIALLMAINFPNIIKTVIADSCVERFSEQILEKSVIQERKLLTESQIKFWEYAHGDDWKQVIEADTNMVTEFTKSGGDWFLGRLSEIICPVLFTASRKDTALNNIIYHISKMSEQVQNSRLYISDKGDHPFMWSSSEEFRYIADYFLDSIDK